MPAIPKILEEVRTAYSKLDKMLESFRDESRDIQYNIETKDQCLQLYLNFKLFEESIREVEAHADVCVDSALREEVTSYRNTVDFVLRSLDWKMIEFDVSEEERRDILTCIPALKVFVPKISSRPE